MILQHPAGSGAGTRWGKARQPLAAGKWLKYPKITKRLNKSVDNTHEIVYIVIAIRGNTR
jgi:hypothetical protein